jgi:signal transduction histidine kinase
MLEWIAQNHIGDLASLAGVAISIVGFIVTVWNVRRSRSAAERAESAANEARRAMRAYQTLSDFSAAIAIMEEIRRLHRVEQPNLYQLLDRYGALRKALIGVRKLSPTLTGNMQTQLQSAITTLATIEHVVERARAEGNSPDFVDLNRLLSGDIDRLYEVLIEMMDTSEGGI